MRDVAFFVECRQSAIKVQPRQSDGSGGKSSNPHTHLTKHHTCRANFLLARLNTQPLVALNYNFDRNRLHFKYRQREGKKIKISENI